MGKFTDVFAEITRPLAKLACAMLVAFLIGGISYCFASEPTALEREQARVQWLNKMIFQTGFRSRGDCYG